MSASAPSKRELPTTIPIVLNVVVIISFIWCAVDAIRGYVHHPDVNDNDAVVRAMSLVWLGFGTLALCNSIAMQKIVSYLERVRE